MTIQSIINGKTKIFDLAFNSMQEKQPKVLYNIFSLCVKANTNNYVFSYYLWQKCFYEKYDVNIFDTRTLKLFRRSLANFIKTGKIEKTEKRKKGFVLEENRRFFRLEK